VLSDVPVQLPLQPSLPPAVAGLAESGPIAADACQSVDSGPLPDEDGDVALLPADSHAPAGAMQCRAASRCSSTVLCEYHVVYHPSYRVPVLCLLPRHQGALSTDESLLVPSMAR